MKKYIINKRFFAFLITLTLLTSCSDDKLTESKIEKLINECPEKLEEINTIYTGYKTELSKRELARYRALEEDGLITFEKVKKKFYMAYQVLLTDKAEPFILSREKTKYDGQERIRVKVCDYKLRRVGTIQEIPAFNGAGVEVEFDKINRTPFYEHYKKEDSEIHKKSIGLKKTENKGWVYCE